MNVVEDIWRMNTKSDIRSPKEPTREETNQLKAIMLEITILFFFDNCIYTFVEKEKLQSSGGPICAHLTTAIFRLVTQL